MKNTLKLIGLCAFTFLISNLCFAQTTDKIVSITGSKTINHANVLLIVDGIKQIPLGTWALNDLNPNDISAIDIFKDSSAMVLFGIDAKDGAIVVTTKAGKSNMNNLVNKPKPFELNTKLNGGDTHRYATVSKVVAFKRRTDGNLNTDNNDLPNPLIIVDGKQFNIKNFEAINASNINSLVILKDAEAINLYGDKAKNGVIVISLKPVTKVETAVKKIE